MRANKAQKFWRVFIVLALAVGFFVISFGAYLIFSKTAHNKQVTKNKETVIEQSGQKNESNSDSVSSNSPEQQTDFLSGNNNSDTKNSYVNPQEFTADQRETTLKIIEQKLKASPNSQLLMSQRDVLLKDWLADPSQDAPKQ